MDAVAQQDVWLTKLATHTAELTAGLALDLRQSGALPDERTAMYVEHFRAIAGHFEAASDDAQAAQFWTAANLLARPST